MMGPMIEHRFRVALHDTDAAGVLFFGHLFRHAHDAYEAMMVRIGWPIDELIQTRQLGLPLVHAEADYRQPMRHGDQIGVVLKVGDFGQRRFSLAYQFLRGNNEVATALTVHVAIDPSTSKSQSLPKSLVTALSVVRGRRCPMHCPN